MPYLAVEEADESTEVWVAIHDFEASDSDEISVAEGEEVFDVEIIMEGWCLGTLSSGERGQIPLTYLRAR